MDLNKRLRQMKDTPAILPREEKLRETVAGCQEAYYLLERSCPMSYGAFLWTQFQYTRKRWWVLQAGVLALACQILPSIESDHYRVRSLGVFGCLFVVLMIPELWRNRETDSTQVEAACFYSLRQIYAARMTLFGIVDVALLTLFGISLGRMDFTLTQMLSQFLLPVTVTACICFSCLCGKGNLGETVSLTACLVWGGAWWLILMNQHLYERIAPSVWAALLVMALGFLALAVRRAVRTTNQYWEVEFL